jgi:acetyl esterase/lipase
MRISTRLHCLRQSILIPVVLVFVCSLSHAQSLRERIQEYRAAHQSQQTDDLNDDDASASISLPAGAKILRDIAYGDDSNQRMDVYLPRQAANAPVIFMVHGGGWRRGDKAMKSVVQNKANRWVAKGFIFVSTNYRMLPNADPLIQAQNVATALAAAQGKAASWGGDPAKFILIGHSAGAHLVALLSASPAMAYQAGARPWLGTVALDSAALDVVQIMEKRHMRLYDPAFGTDPAFWRKVSPFHLLTVGAPPLLAVCSSRRNDSCVQAQGFVDKATSLNARMRVLKENLTHKEINEELGAPGAYTDAVEAFMTTLEGSVGRLLVH